MKANPKVLHPLALALIEFKMKYYKHGLHSEVILPLLSIVKLELCNHLKMGRNKAYRRLCQQLCTMTHECDELTALREASEATNEH